MIDQSLLKSCLDVDFYNQNKAKLRPSIFDDAAWDGYQTIVTMHDKFNKDISSLELFAFWKAQNPTSTGSWTAEIEDQINCINNAETIDPEITNRRYRKPMASAHRYRRSQPWHNDVRR